MDNLGLEKLLTQLWFDDVRGAQGMKFRPMNRFPGVEFARPTTFDNPLHRNYDYHSLYRAGYKPSDVGPDGHLPSAYKRADHPNRFVHDPDWYEAQKDKDLNVIFDKNRRPLRDTKTTSEPWIRKGKPYYGPPKGPR